MAVAHAEPPLPIPTPASVDPLLRVVLPEREHRGGSRPAEDQPHLAKLVEAPVVLGVRSPEEFPARLTVKSTYGETSVRASADIAMREAGAKRAVVLRCRASDLTLALITVLDSDLAIRSPRDLPPPVLFWSLASRSGDATARADVLDFLRAIHQGGQLEIVATDRDSGMGTLDVPGAPFDPDLERDWAFLTDVATLEEWSGVPLPLPTEVPAAEVAQIRQAAEMVRSRRVPVTFNGDVTAAVSSDVDAADELHLEQEFGISVFGFEVPLGVGRAHFPVTVVDAKPDPDAGVTRVTFRPVESDQPISFQLEPPAERTPYKRTLAGGEIATAEEDVWPEDWAEGEREADHQLRSNQGIRFATEEAFFAWLADPRDSATE